MDQTKEEELECAVCLQPCVHPVKLPCSHIFCFLCVKGVANQSKRCAMCRQEIPADYLDNPTLLKKIDEKESEIEGYQWFYEGRNGWWQYDERTSLDLETSYNAGLRVCEVLVAGFLYTVDFDRMLQQRRNDPSRRRRIKRDMASIPKKGVAGLKTFDENAQEDDLSCDTSNISNLLHPQQTTSDSSQDPEVTSNTVSLTNSNESDGDTISSESPNASEPPEILQDNLQLSNLYPVHSDLRRNSGSLSHPNYPLLRNRGLRTREQVSPVATQRSSALLNDLNIQSRLRQLRNENSSNNSRAHPVTVNDLTNSLVELSVGEEEEIIQYYSLDDTEEYRLPNEDEL